MVAGLVPLFAVLPTLKVFVSPTIGAVKDVVTLAAISAAAMIVLSNDAPPRPGRSRRGSRCCWSACSSRIYAINLGGLLTGQTGHGAAWYPGSAPLLRAARAVGRGLALPSPERTMRAATRALSRQRRSDRALRRRAAGDRCQPAAQSRLRLRRRGTPDRRHAAELRHAR